MAKDDKGPRVPEGPTVIPGPQASEAAAPAGVNDSDAAKGKLPFAQAAAGDEEQRKSGGRRPYEDILAENKILEKRVQELVGCVRVLADVPIDPKKQPEEVQYALSKGGRAFNLTAAQVLAARRALGMVG